MAASTRAISGRAARGTYHASMAPEVWSHGRLLPHPASRAASHCRSRMAKLAGVRKGSAPTTELVTSPGGRVSTLSRVALSTRLGESGVTTGHKC